MEQIKGKHFCEDAKAGKKSPNPGGSDMNHEERLVTISSTMSSMMEPQHPLQTPPCVLLEVPGFFFYPIQISASKERSERAGTSSSNPLLNMEPEIPQPSYINEDYTDSDSRSSSPFSAEFVSTDSSGDFQSDQNERCFSNESPPSIRRRRDQNQQDETTQDEITQRLQQRVSQMNEVVESMRAKKHATNMPIAELWTQQEVIGHFSNVPLVMEQINGNNYCKDPKAGKKRPNSGGSDTNQEGKVGAIPSTISSIMESEDPLETSPCVPEEFPGFSFYPIQTWASEKGTEGDETSASKPLSQDEITQRLQQRVRKLNEVVERIRAKKQKL